MEVAGLAVGVAGLASLLSACIDAVDRVDTYRKFGLESRYITAKFAADKFLLQKWAETVGISDGRLQNVHHRDLDRDEVVSAIARILSSIREIFSATNSLSSNLQGLSLDSKSSFPIDPDNYANNHSTEEKKSRSLAPKTIGKLYDIIPLEGTNESVDSDIVRGLGEPSNSLRGFSKEKSTWFSSVYELLDQLKMEERKEVYLWLGAVNTKDTYEKHLSARLENTCGWIFSKSEYVSWASSDFPFDAAKVLWIHGPAGYGKSVLCARLVQQLQTTHKYPLAYFFCSSDQDPFSMIRSWVSQLVSSSQDAFEIAQQQMRARGGPSASTTDIWDLFNSIVHCGEGFTYVVDGLDECLRSENNRASGDDCNRRAFLVKLKGSISQTTSRLLIVSRDEGDIRSGICLDAMTSLKLTTYEYGISKTDVLSDVMSFSKCIVDNKLWKKSEILRQDLATQMAQKSEGMFLWVRLQERSLRNSKNRVKLQEIVNDMPIGLTDAYKRDWDRISKLQDRDMYRALAILRWTIFAVRPMTVLEMTEALAVRDEDGCDSLQIDELPDVIDDEYIIDEILDLCGSLVESRDAGPEKHLEDKTVGLVHISVQEFLLSRTSMNISLSGHDCENNYLAKICLRYLDYNSSWKTSSGGLSQHPFLDYAVRSWILHVNSSGSNYKDLIRLVNKFFNPSGSHWINWRNRYEILATEASQRLKVSQDNHGGLLYYAALFGLVDTLQFLQDQKVEDWDSVGGQYGTALQAASAAGHLSAVSFLIDRGANIDAQCGLHGCAVNAAADSGNDEIIRVLVIAGASLSIGDEAGCMPLHMASRKGRAEVVKLLLDQGADLSIASTKGSTPLNAAANNGHLEVVKVLLNRGADLSVANTNGLTPLYSASLKGHLEVVKVLLDQGADLSVANTDGWTPLNAAANNGHLEVVKLLLDQGADHNAESGNYGNTLHIASHKGHVEIAEMLLNKVTNIHYKDRQGRTALHLACAGGNLATIKLLSNVGLDPTTTDMQGRDCLHHGASNGSASTTTWLLKQGLNPNLMDRNDWTSLHWAAKSGSVETLETLRNAGSISSHESINGWTPQAIALFHHCGYLPILTSGVHNEITSRYTVPEHAASHAVPKDDPYTTGDQISPGPIHRARCDGCFLEICGPRYKCLECTDFDYCFKCKASSDVTHAPHRFEKKE
ncbi:hypothetical protein ABVK25_011834 [Lepraria finkii]|uniref:ZZ-type domain-containing protein n=1 Tax=Lepraria finkii TaxID=1340010 RepID=A0ABR4ALT0_9LECA